MTSTSQDGTATQAPAMMAPAIKAFTIGSDSLG